MEIQGIGVSPGVAIGKACIIKKTQTAVTGVLIDDAEITLEIGRFDHAVILAINEIESIKYDPARILSEEDIAILETHIELISDPQIKDDATELITIGKKTANDAIVEITQNLVEMFRNMDDEYMQARAADMEDIGNRILKHLNGAVAENQKFEPGTIIIAEDLSPSDTITMDLNCVIGFATQAGSTTSHSAIIARARSVPAVVGCGVQLLLIKDGDTVVIDGKTGHIDINPDDEARHQHKIKQEAFIRQSEKLKLLKDIPSVTTDGIEIILSANISGAGDMDDVFHHGGQGVGLFRTELLFMGRDTFPTEDEQFEFYKQTALKATDKPVIVRTIDIGGDKQIPYFGLPIEENPFLGYRAIRICLDREDIFITQLRAILRASAFGDLKIMLPMISNVKEIRQAKNMLNTAKNELRRDHISFNADIEVGIMIEIPSAAIMADILAKEVDFFSIGTNDLCQYTLAVDRMNEKISHLYDPFNPGVLRLIANVIEQANKHRIHVGMCGEMAGNPLATILLLGMGLRDFSMSAAAIPTIKNMVIHNDMQKAKQVCQKVMEMDNSDDIKTYLEQFIK